jgi:hypothetical protein
VTLFTRSTNCGTASSNSATGRFTYFPDEGHRDAASTELRFACLRTIFQYRTVWHKNEDYRVSRRILEMPPGI